MADLLFAGIVARHFAEHKVMPVALASCSQMDGHKTGLTNHGKRVREPDSGSWTLRESTYRLERHMRCIFSI